MNQTDPLAALRPLHPPADIPWWPPAPGWWLLLAIAIIVAMFTWWRWRRGALRRAAMAELNRIKQDSHDPARQAARLNNLLKRYAIAVEGDRRHGALTGDAWLAHLQRSTGLDPEKTRLLLTLPYLPADQAQTHATNMAELVELSAMRLRNAAARRPN